MKNAFLFLYVSLLGISLVFAQRPDSQVVTPSPSIKRNVAFSLATPKDAVTSHLYFLQEETYNPDLSANTLFPGTLSQNKLQELAIELIQIFDGTGIYVDVDDIPTDPSYEDSLGRNRYVISKVYPSIYVEKYENEWRYSRRTVAEIPVIHQKVYPYGADLLVNLMPGVGKKKVFGLHLWQYLGMLLMMVGAFLFYKVLYKILSWGLRRIVPLIFRRVSLQPEDAYPVAKPLALLLVTLFVISFVPVLQLSIVFGKYVIMVLKISASFFGVMVVYKLVDLMAAIGTNAAALTETTMDDHLLPMVTKILKIIVVVFGIIFILQNMDVNVTALLAGVSIGGLALALAAQDTVKNFLGSVAIFVDRPFQIGDYITASSLEGSVVEVGVRSTRILDPGGATISIPNGTLANMMVTNHGVRTFRRYVKTLNVTYDTPPQKIENFVEAVREIVKGHPFAQKEGNVVQFHEMSDSSLDIYLSVFFTITGYEDYLKSRQTLLMAILKKANEMEIDFAFPTQTIMLEGDK